MYVIASILLFLGIVMIAVGIYLIVSSLKEPYETNLDGPWRLLGEAAWFPRFENLVIFNYDLYGLKNKDGYSYKVVKKNDKTEFYYITDSSKLRSGDTISVANPKSLNYSMFIVRF